MILVERIEPEEAARLTDKPLAPFKKSTEIWAVRNDGELVLVAGVINFALVGSTEMWVIPIERGMKLRLWSTMRAVRSMVAEAKRRYPRLIAQVAASSHRDRTFAELCGFEERRVRADAPDWLIYEVA